MTTIRKLRRGPDSVIGTLSVWKRTVYRQAPRRNERKGTGINMERKSFGIYIHIPFCVKKCQYCDFLSFPIGSDALAHGSAAPASGNASWDDSEPGAKACRKAGNFAVEAYVQALCREIERYGNTGESIGEEFQADTLFIGGGTPSLLTPGQIRSVFEALARSFGIRKGNLKEATIECNPGTLTPDRLAAYLDCGINRLSIGLQSADNEELKMLGRIHTWEEFLQSYEMARRAGFQNINIDLMSGLPGQSAESWSETLKKAVGLNPEHISAYSLIIEEGTPFYDRYGENANDPCGSGSLPDEDAEREMYEWTGRFLRKKGYERYEISNYSKPAYECRHNLSYWKRIPYLGLGLGASSLIKGRRWHNTDVFEEYLKDADKPERIRREEIILTQKDAMEEFMFLGLRVSRGILKSDFEREFGISIETIYGNQIRKLAENGLLAETDGRLALTERGIDVSNPVLAEFLLED